MSAPELQPIVGVVAVPEEVAQAPEGYLAYDGRPKAARPVWLPAAAAAAVGVLVAGALGYALFATTQQRDAVRHQLARRRRRSRPRATS